MRAAVIWSSCAAQRRERGCHRPLFVARARMTALGRNRLFGPTVRYRPMAIVHSQALYLCSNTTALHSDPPMFFTECDKTGFPMTLYVPARIARSRDLPSGRKPRVLHAVSQ